MARDVIARNLAVSQNPCDEGFVESPALGLRPKARAADSGLHSLGARALVVSRAERVSQFLAAARPGQVYAAEGYRHRRLHEPRGHLRPHQSRRPVLQPRLGRLSPAPLNGRPPDLGGGYHPQKMTLVIGSSGTDHSARGQLSGDSPPSATQLSPSFGPTGSRRCARLPGAVVLELAG
jgi:hypothetical protein